VIHFLLQFSQAAKFLKGLSNDINIKYFAKNGSVPGQIKVNFSFLRLSFSSRLIENILTFEIFGDFLPDLVPSIFAQLFEFYSIL
jgi:hypothetical protein